MEERALQSPPAIHCAQCAYPLSIDSLVASMSGSIMGDEHTDSYYLCPRCDTYTVVSWWDNFTGVESIDVSGPVARRDGDERVRLIGECPRAWDKKCRCPAHRRHFRDTLD